MLWTSLGCRDCVDIGEHFLEYFRVEFHVINLAHADSWGICGLSVFVLIKRFELVRFDEAPKYSLVFLWASSMFDLLKS